MGKYLIIEFLLFNMADIIFELYEYFRFYYLTFKLLWVLLILATSLCTLLALYRFAKTNFLAHKYFGSAATVIIIVGMLEKSFVQIHDTSDTEILLSLLALVSSMSLVNYSQLSLALAYTFC